jgi:regulatory protein
MSSTDEKDQIVQAMNRAYFFLKFRPRTEKEVRDYLQKKSEKFYQWSPSTIDSAIEKLKDNHYIDDSKFVEWFVNQRTTGKPKSAFALSHELQKYGIDKDTFTAFFDENPVDEENLALSALKKRWPRYQYLNKKERFQKAVTFLSSRGFKFDIIRKSIEQLETDL